MMGLLMESVVIAFGVGGVLGAVVALHWSEPKANKVKIDRKQRHRQRR